MLELPECHQSLRYPSGSSILPLVPPSPPSPPLVLPSHYRSLHPPTSHSIIPLSSHQSFHPPTSPPHPCTEVWETREGIAFPEWNLSLCPLEGLTGQHFQICTPRTSFQGLLVLSPHVTDANKPRTAPSNPSAIPCPGSPCTDRSCSDPSPLPHPALTEHFQLDFQALPVSCHSVGATVTFLDILQQERSVGWIENSSSCIGSVDGWGQDPPVVLQDEVGATAIEEFPAHGIAVGDVFQPREQHRGSHSSGSVDRSCCFQSWRERQQQPWREERGGDGAGSSALSLCPWHRAGNSALCLSP